MKKIFPILMIVCLLLTGCGIHWNYYTTIKTIDNDYFKTKVIHEDDECMIIENEVTGEYFLVVADNYGVTITPIEMSEMIVNPKEMDMGEWMNCDSKSESMSEGAEGE